MHQPMGWYVNWGRAVLTSISANGGGLVLVRDVLNIRTLTGSTVDSRWPQSRTRPVNLPLARSANR